MTSFVFKCKDVDCRQIIICRYLHILLDYYYKDFFLIPSFQKKNFDEFIKTISNDFVELYNQSAKAEEYGCKDIAGAGYRKALEFIIKDFAIDCNNNDKEEITKMSLSTVIEKYIHNSKLKEITKRAVWLGNDETHYERKWDKNIEDLKKLIDIAVHYITMEKEVASYIAEMFTNTKSETKT
jgi:hypothetical protein